MENLAVREYNRDADEKVRIELEIANIDVQKLPAPLLAEVKTRYMGQLGNWKFSRAWSYWVAETDAKHALSVETALRLYEKYDPKDTRIRPHGLAGGSDEDIRNWNKPVDVYHIDTQLGLCKFAEFLRTL
jgi:hypothetical protein